MRRLTAAVGRAKRRRSPGRLARASFMRLSSRPALRPRWRGDRRWRVRNRRVRSRRGRPALAGVLSVVDGPHRADGGNGVLVDHELLTLALEHHREVVEGPDNALELDAVHEVHRDRDVLLADLVEHSVLEIGGCAHHCVCVSPQASLALCGHQHSVKSHVFPPAEVVISSTLAGILMPPLSQRMRGSARSQVICLLASRLVFRAMSEAASSRLSRPPR